MVRKTVRWLLLGVLLTAADGWAQDDDVKLTFNFKDARIEDVLTYVSSMTGWKFVYEKAKPPKGTVTAISDGPISQEQALVLLDTALQQHGLATINPFAPRLPKKGETVKIVTSKDAMKMNVEVRFGSDPDKIAPTEKVITQIIPLRGANVVDVDKEMKKVLEACVKPDGTYAINTYSNSLIFTGRSEGIRRAALILKVVDIEAKDRLQTKVFPLVNADATETAKILTEIFKKEERAQPGNQNPIGRWMRMFGGGRARGGTSGPEAKDLAGDVVRIMADTRTNSVVCVATEANIKTIEGLVRQLDAKSAEIIKLKVYPLRYADAENTAKLIEDLFNKEKKDAGTQGNRPWWVRRGGPGQTEEKSVASSREVRAVADVRTNAVIVAASERNFELLDGLVKGMDRQVSDMLAVKVYELRNADAEQMAKILQDVFRPQITATRSAGRPTTQPGRGGRMGFPGGASAGKTSLSPNEEVEVTSDKRTNAVIVKASPEYIKIMDEIVDKLDRNPTESKSTYVLSLKYANATDVATVIRDLLQGTRTSRPTTTRTTGSSRTTGSNTRNSSRNTRTRGGSSSTRRGGNLGPLEQEGPRETPLAQEEEDRRRGVEGDVDVQADGDTNSLVVRTSPRNFEALQTIVRNLDRLRPQVLIKVLIADVTLNNEMQFGVEGFWQNKMTVGGGDKATNRFGTDFSLATKGFTYKLTGDEFEGSLNMFAEEGRLKILATPRILVLDNQTANINVGKEVPVITNTTVNSLGNTVNTVRYEDVGIMLEVTPQINPDGLVTMTVRPEVSDIATAAESVQITEGVTSPTFIVNSAETTVAVQNGQTVVIGGLIREVIDESKTKVPILGDIPILGLLFSSTTKIKSRRELMIFLTPYVAYTRAELEEITEVEKARLKILDQKEIESESDKWLDRVRR